MLLLTDIAETDLDNALLRRARGGDSSAFRQLVQRHHDTIHRWALAMTGDPDDADDVEQTALLRVHHALAEYRGVGRFRTWLYPIVRAAATDLLRTRSSTQPVQSGSSSLSRQAPGRTTSRAGSARSSRNG